LNGRCQKHADTWRNLIDRETLYGYRSFELWEGGVTNPGFPVDVLIAYLFLLETTHDRHQLRLLVPLSSIMAINLRLIGKRPSN
jgi:hypothetical protein